MLHKDSRVHCCNLSLTAWNHRQVKECTSSKPVISQAAVCLIALHITLIQGTWYPLGLQAFTPQSTHDTAKATPHMRLLRRINQFTAVCHAKSVNRMNREERPDTHRCTLS